MLQHNPQPQSWLPARVDVLAALWSSTLGAAEIAMRLNKQFPEAKAVSPDAVQKKAAATGLPSRPRPANGAAKPIKRAIMHRGAGFGVLRDGEPQAPTIFREDDLPVETRKAFMELRFATKDHPADCRWPGSSDFYCGLPADDGRVFCRAHCYRAYVNYQPQGTSE